MLDPTHLPLYFAALVAVYLAPGPDMALVMATSASRGARAGLYTAGGIAVARFLHVLGSGLGLAALFAASPVLLAGVRGAGAAYLLWLAWKVLRPASATPALAGGSAGPSASECSAQVQACSAQSEALRGLLTNVLNPKALLFCGLLLPQFANPEHGPLLPQFLILGVILVVVGLCFDAVYACMAGGLARRLRAGVQSGSPFAVCLDRVRSWLMGSVFLAMAARLAVG